MTADRTAAGLRNLSITDPREVEQKLRGFIQSVHNQATTIRSNWINVEGDLDDYHVLTPADRIIRRCAAADRAVKELSGEMTRLRRKLALDLITPVSRHPELDDHTAASLLDEADRVWYCLVIRDGAGASCTPESPHDPETWGCRWMWEALVPVEDP